MFNLSSPVPYPALTIGALMGLCALLFIAFSVPATVPSKAKSRDKTEGI